MLYSSQSDMAKIMQRIVNGPMPEEPELRAAVELLRRWDLRTDPDNIGTALAVLTVQPLVGQLDEVALTTLMASLANAVDTLQEAFGRIDVPWQEVNRLRRGDLDLGLLQGYAGDSYVLLVTWDASGVVSSDSIHQFGSATLDENSPHYADQSVLFVNRRLKPVWMDEAEIRANLEIEYRPGEEIER
jgi:penicillin amidase/acyl-homoserine-lactone acylase